MEEDRSNQQQEEEALAVPSNSSSSRPHAVSHDDVPASTTAMYADHEATQMTCDVLCSLSAGTGAGAVSAMAPSSATVGSSDNESNTMYTYNNSSNSIMGKAKKSSSLSSVSKSHQLP